MAKDGDPKTILSKFLDWVCEHGGRHMLYRGIADTEKKRPALTAIARRLQDEGENEGEFIRANQELIETVKMRGHGDQKKLQHDLEILAELQHYGAATCLMDFTRNPFAGLWFACKNPALKNGRVLAINSVDYNRFVKVNAESMQEPIGDLLPSSRRKGRLWVWEPKRQNERIIAQQSVFVFGAAKIQPEHVFSVKSTDGVWDELQKYGVSLESLFCDFDGFARANTSAQQYGAGNYLDKAMDEHAHEKYENAIEHYSRALIASGNESIYYHRGRAKMSLGVAARNDHKKADAYYKQALEDYNKSPEDKQMLFHRAIAKRRLSDYEGAIADYSRMIEMAPQHAKAYINRGRVKEQLGDHEDAIADYDWAIEISPQFAAAHYNLALAKRQSGDYKDAIASYDRVIEISPKHVAAYFGRGLAKYKLGDYEGAIADYDRAIEINPQDMPSYNNRGNSKYEMGDHEGAITDYNRAIEIKPQDSPAYHNRGLAKYKLGDYEGTIADYDRVIEILPQGADGYNNRGYAKKKWCDNEGAKAAYDYASAIADFDRAIELNPHLALAYYNRGNVKKAQGDKDGTAEADFQKTKEIDPSFKHPEGE